MTDTMMRKEPGVDLNEALRVMGDTGCRLAAIHAVEGAAGNISICIRGEIDPRPVFAVVTDLPLDAPVPSLADSIVLLTGSGCRLGEVAADVTGTVGAVVIGAHGTAARLFTSPRRRFERLSVECGAHLAVHAERLGPELGALHALIHAQPPYLTYLTHVPEYRGADAYSRAVLRWHPELVFHLRDGIGYVPFTVPGTRELADATLVEMRSHRLVAWEKHGVISRSGESLAQACDWIEYAEAGARFACMDLANGNRAEGLTPAEIRKVCDVTGIEHSVF
jgi:rhamnulose-1-phosphate aldolase